MTSRARPPSRLRRSTLAAAGAGVIVLALIAVLGGGLAGSSGRGASASGGVGGAGTAPSSPATGASSSAAGASSSAGGASASASARPSSNGTAGSVAPTSGASASASPGDATAPTSAAGFLPRATIISMGWVFRRGTAFTYGDAFALPRDGVVYPYNLARGRASNGALLRAHDGQDLVVPIGTIVLAPFAGVVVDPSTIWRPWDPQRYGKVIAIRSMEPTSSGYYAILVHLSRQSVPVGTVVRRGQVVGRTGDSGNDRGLAPQLHFELRAPFRIRYGYGHVIRWVDAFDPLPSLKAALAAS